MIIGITGSIACGKSAVSQYLIKKGYTVIDSDLIVKDAYQDQMIQKELTNHFHTLNPKEIGKIVFNDYHQKEILESIIHPYVFRTLELRIKDHKNEKYVFLDIPLLYECHLEYLTDKIMVVYASYQTQLKRLMKRNGYSQDYAKQIIAGQMSSEEKKQRGDIVLDNNKDLESLYQQIDQNLERMQYEESKR